MASLATTLQATERCRPTTVVIVDAFTYECVWRAVARYLVNIIDARTESPICNEEHSVAGDKGRGGGNGTEETHKREITGVRSSHHAIQL